LRGLWVDVVAFLRLMIPEDSFCLLLALGGIKATAGELEHGHG
jgi:hypothetical protein